MAKKKRRSNPSRPRVGSVITITRTGHYRTPCYTLAASGPFSYVIAEGTDALIEDIEAPGAPECIVVSIESDGRDVLIEVEREDYRLISA